MNGDAFSASDVLMDRPRPSWALAVAWAGRWPVACVMAGAMLVALGAQVRVPLPGTDVPMTLQGLAVLLAGLVLPPGQSAVALLLYLACGAAGLPVFAAGSSGMLGPTGGYLVGFVLAAPLIGAIGGGGAACFWRMLAAGTVGQAAIFLLGVGWRVLYSSGDVAFALATGLLPFLPKAGLVAVLAATAVTALRGRRR